MTPKNIIVLGAGYAGVQAALTLYKRKKKHENINIILIDKNPYHTLLTVIHEVAGNRINDDGVLIPLKNIFQYTDVNIVTDEITGFDFENKKLTSKHNEYTYDYLIVATGSEPNFYDIPGLQEYGYTLWSYNDAVKIREHIMDCFILASQEKDPHKRKALLSFVVGGGGLTGVELIGELAHWINKLCIDFEIPKSETQLILVEMLPNILRTISPESAKKATEYLINKLHVDIRTGACIVEVSEHSVKLKSGEEIHTETLVWTAGIKPAKLGEEISIKGGNTCRVEVDKFTRTKFEDVYAVGDVAAFKEGESTLPALVETALQTGHAAAINILSEIRGKEKKELKPKFHGVIISVGNRFAIAEIMGKRMPLLIAILLKNFVNIHYLFGIGGFEQVAKYLKNEFLDKRQKKSHFEKHYTKTTLAMWLVPLRLFIGYAWLSQAISKIKDGWLVDAMLSGMPTDATTSASLTESGEKIFQIVNESTPIWYAWIAENIIIPNALFFQILIVLIEAGLGLAFLTGTMTFLAGLISLGMNLNFILSTGLYQENWWYIPASIAMLAGAGRAFGFDHYLIPYLMRQWRYFVRNKRLKFLLFN